MSVLEDFALQSAVFDRLSAQTEYTVFDHLPKDPPQKYVRLDGFTVQNAAAKNTNSGLHGFTVKCIQRPSDGQIKTVGQMAIKGMQSDVYSALINWAPFDASDLQFESAFVDDGEDGVTMVGTTRWTIKI